MATNRAPTAGQSRPERPPGAITAALLALGLLRLAFDDLPLLSAGGKLASSPAWIPLGAFAVLASLKPTRTVTVYRILFAYGTVLTLLLLFFLPSAARGEDLVLKAIKVALAVLAFLVVMRVGSGLRKHHLTIAAAASTVSLLILIVSSVALSPLAEPQWLHTTINFAQRVRGTRFEASSLGAGILVLTCIVAMLINPGRKRSLLLLGALLSAVYLVPSRGTIAALLLVTPAILCLVVSQILRRPDRPADRQPLSARVKAFPNLVGLSAVIASAILTFALPQLVTSDLWAGFARSFSDSTRSAWSLVSLESLKSYPMGQGWAAPTTNLGPMLADVSGQLVRAFGVTDMGEVVGLVRGETDQGLSPKTLPSLIAIYFGVPGLLLWFATIFHITRSSFLRVTSRPWHFVSALTIVAVSSSYYASIYAWDQALLLGLLLTKSPPTSPEKVD